jgi:hypothetical protein
MNSWLRPEKSHFYPTPCICGGRGERGEGGGWVLQPRRLNKNEDYSHIIIIKSSLKMTF